MKIFASLIITATLVLGGCATPLGPNETRIDIKSNPPGATISADGNSKLAPAIYQITTPSARETSLITVTWISGATTSKKLTFDKPGQYEYTFQRPVDAPGLQQDVAYAIHLDGGSTSKSSSGSSAYEFGQALGSILSGGKGGSGTGSSRPQTCVTERDRFSMNNSITTTCR